MSQTSYDYEMKAAFPGKLDNSARADISNLSSIENIPFGRMVIEQGNNNTQARLPSADTIKFDADFASGMQITGNVIVYDEATQTSTTTAITPVSWNTNQSTTLGNLNTAIDAVTGVSTSLSAPDRQIVASVASGKYVYLSGFAVSGSGVPNIVYGLSKEIRGASIHKHKVPDSSGVSQYVQKDEVDILEEGTINIICEDAFTTDSNVYTRIVDESGDNQKRGMLKTSAGGVAIANTNYRFRNSGSAGDLAKVKLIQ